VSADRPHDQGGDLAFRILKSASAALPDVRVSAERFAAFIAELEPELAEKNGTDLVLAFACAEGDTAAMAIVEQTYFATEVDAPCRRAGIVAPEEMRQRVRTKLFVGPPPRIASYGGRSSLRAWLRAVIGRLVIDAARERPREVPTDDDKFTGVAGVEADPDRRFAQESYQQALEAAFELAATRLSPREKNLLRYALADGLNIDQIGAIYGVHRVTAHRWVTAARVALTEQIRGVMMERFKMSASEYNSVVRLVMSRVDVTIARIFKGTQEERE
jgi:RNA polymerase sigma-70 factor (ECF subfamily)